MALYGPRRLVDIALPSGWDGAALAKFELQDGTSIEAVAQDVILAVAALNSELASNSLMAQLTYQTTSRSVMYRDGGSGNEMQTHTEFSLPVEERGAVEGHMAPRNKRDAGLAWSWDYLNDAIMEHLDADIAVAVEQVRNSYEKAVLTRFFTATHNTVETSGYDVGLADGNASTVVWAPPPYAGQSFLTTHTHLVEYATANLATTFNPAAKHLYEHGHMPPYIALVSETDRATYTALSDFTPRRVDSMQYGATQDLAIVEEPYIGVITTDYGAVLVRPLYRIPTAYLCMFKSYGANSPKNPLRWWYNPMFGPGAVALPGKAYRRFPLEGMMLYAEYGFTGGQDRTNGIAIEIGSGGTYSNPTIS